MKCTIVVMLDRENAMNYSTLYINGEEESKTYTFIDC